MAENTVIEPIDAVSPLYLYRFKAIPWDGVLSESNPRAWYSCPLCGLAIIGSLVGVSDQTPIMVHKECYEALKNET